MVNACKVVTIVDVGVMVGVGAELSVAFVIDPIPDALPENRGQLGRAHGDRLQGAVCRSGASPPSPCRPPP